MEQGRRELALWMNELQEKRTHEIKKHQRRNNQRQQAMTANDNGHNIEP